MPAEEIVDELRVPDGRRVRPLPLRHVRHRVPQGAARRRLRRLPRAAVPADGRPQAGDRRGRGPRDEPDVLHRRCSRRSSSATCSTRSATASARTRSSRARPTARSRASKKLISRRVRERSTVAARGAAARRAATSASVKVDRTIAKPKVSIIGEFWAMTTEGDGNYGLQRFLEAEGAECDIQLVTAWLLYMIWEQPLRHAAAHGAARRRHGAQGPRRAQDVAQEAGDAVARRARASAASSRRSRTSWACTTTTCPTWTRSPRPRRRSTTTISAAAKATWRSAS